MNKLNELLSKIILKLNISVKAEEQIFTEEQKAQVRENIGAGLPQVQADYSQNDATARDYIKNRPVYTEQQVLTYNGNPDIREETTPQGIYLVKVSDELIDFNNIKQVTVQPENGEPITVEITPDMVQITTEGDIVTLFNISYNEMVVPIAAVTTFPLNTDFVERNGTYLCGYENEIMNGYVSRIEFQENIHKLDIKYLPDGGFGYSDAARVVKTIEWDGNIGVKLAVDSTNPTIKFVKISDTPLEITTETLKSLILGDGNTTSEVNLDDLQISSGSDVCIVTTNYTPVVLSVFTTYNINGTIAPKGLYFLTMNEEGNHVHIASISVETDGEEIHKIDPKYYDRLAWEEKEVVFEISGEEEVWNIEDEGLFELKDGTEYLVKIDDVEYKQIAKSMSSDGITLVYIGNIAIMGEDVDTGEPFIFASVMGFSIGALIDSNTGEYLSGYHEVSIIAQEVHKIEDKYLPDIAISHADMAESNPYAPSYVKNRSFYNGIAVNLQELVQAGAPTVTTGTNNALQFVKIADYFVPDDSILDTRLIINGKINSLRTDNTLNIKENGTWEIIGFDIRYMIGLTKSSIESGSVHGYIVSENFEDGVYFACKFLGVPVAGEVYLPITKKIDKDVVSLSYSDLSDIPFGDIPDKVVSFDVECVRNAASYIVKRKYNDDGSTKDITYRRAHAYISPRIGMTLLLSDESRMEISESDIEILQQNLVGGAEKDRYAIRDLIIFDKGDSVSHDSFSVSSDKVVSINSKLPSGSAGIYLNLDADDGVYVTGIVIEDGYTKQLDIKFIPPELPAVTASDNGKFLRVVDGKWATSDLPTWTGGSY